MFLRGAFQRPGMLFPEFQAAVDAHRLQEAGPVGLPVRQLGGRGRRGGGCACGRGVTGRGWHGGRRGRGRHQRQRARVGADLREQCQQGVAVEAVALGHLAHEGLHVQMFGVVAGNGLGAGGQSSCAGSRCGGRRRGCRGGLVLSGLLAVCGRGCCTLLFRERCLAHGVGLGRAFGRRGRQGHRCRAQQGKAQAEGGKPQGRGRDGRHEGQVG